MTIPSWLSTVASVGMAVGPPLVYADQSVSMVRKKYHSAFRLQKDITYSFPGTPQVSLVTSVLYCGSYFLDVLQVNILTAGAKANSQYYSMFFLAGKSVRICPAITIYPDDSRTGKWIF